jgi:hypothetical protein
MLNDDLERIRKEAVVTYSKCTVPASEGAEETKKPTYMFI